MPTSNKPSLDADEASEALRGLAHATRSIDDPTEIYAVLGSLSAGSRLWSRRCISSDSSTMSRRASGMGDR